MSALYKSIWLPTLVNAVLEKNSVGALNNHPLIAFFELTWEG